ncbi:MAG TPA: 3'-5' exonuclease [Streptosporangiaceae bacterium]|nr:3'-5' exonuclease [Streptosporangiaceae bacterium]
MGDWTSRRYIVIDVEGNGQQPPDLVELATVPIVGGVIEEPSSWLVRPELPIAPLARKIHGITNEDVAAAPAFADVRDEVLRALNGAVLVAHNAHLDVGVLRRELGDWASPEVLDTLKLSRRLLPGRPSYRLGSLAGEFKLADGLPDDLRPHRAMYDVLVTARLFVRLATPPGFRPRSMEELRGELPGGSEGEATTLF